MQVSHVFIACWACEVRFPHGFIAFPLFIFLGVPRWLPMAIFDDFGRPLGASWALLGGPWGPLSGLGVPLGALPLGTMLVTILISWGVLWRSHGPRDMSLATTLIVWMSKSRNNATIPVSLCASPCKLYTYRFLCHVHLSVSPSSYTSPLHASCSHLANNSLLHLGPFKCALVIRTSHLRHIWTSQSHL